jgi:hypothetical protein
VAAGRPERGGGCSFVFDLHGRPGPVGRAQFEQVLAMFRAAFPH